MERQVAARYAEALFTIAKETQQIDRIGEELEDAARLLAEMPELARLLDHPELEEKKKFLLLDKAFGEKVLAATLSLLKLMVRRHRIALAGLVRSEYGLMVDEARGIARVRVATAAPLAPAQTQRLQEALARLLGKQVVMESHVDRGLLAGVRLQIGHRQIDGSAAGRLEALHSRLKEAGVG